MRDYKIASALVCALLLTAGFGLPARCSPSAYTETRSFRDALDGRSMEEVLSGPVDKDTSSYGDRTGMRSSARSMQSQIGPMMLNIPANGNLMAGSINDQQQQQQVGVDQQSQQKSASGGELEFETTPVEDSNSRDFQQRSVEQGSSGRQMQAAAMAMSARQLKMKNARQQQEQDYSRPASASGLNAGASKGVEPGFGEEQSGATGSAKGAKKGETKSSGDEQRPQKYDRDEQQNQQQTDVATDEQQVISFGKGGSTEMSAEQANLNKQKMMAAMLMSMSKAMNYQNPSSMMTTVAPSFMAMQAPAYGTQNTKNSNGNRKSADSMLMSMMNMKAMMNSQARPMMMAAYKANEYQKSQGSGYNGNGRGGMRRANQRKSMKKMSPAMVNTLLNKMMNSSKSNGAAYTNSGMMAPKPDAMAMLMKTTAGAELLANMMATPQMMSSATANARDQYKRMMMAAIMKQASMSGRNLDSYSNGPAAQEQQKDDSFDSRQSSKSATGAYSAPMGAMGQSTMSPLVMMMNLMNAQKQTYSGMEQEQQTSMTETPSYASDRARKSKPSFGRGQQSMDQSMNSVQSGFGEEQQQRELSSATKSSRPVSNSMAMMMSNGAAARGAAMEQANQGSRYPAMQSSSPQQKYGEQSDVSGDNEQQQQSDADASTKNSKSEMDTTPSFPTMPSVPRPTSSSMNGLRQSYQKSTKGEQKPDEFEQRPAMQMSFGNSNSGQQQMVADDEQQQQLQQDENGAAPRGMAEPFAFDYKVEDDYGNEHYRKEESDKNGAVRGSYGYMDNNGIYRHVDYVADENGFRANVKSNEPGLSSDSAKPSSAGSASPQLQSASMARPAAAGQSVTGTQTMSQILDVAQMMEAQVESNQQQQQQMPASQTELNDSAELK